jgi:GDP-L-fucose synthase
MKVVVAGGTGLVGSAVAREFANAGHNVLIANTSNVNLLNKSETLDFIQETAPDAVIDAAAQVGGIGANSNYPVEFLVNNLTIQNNLIGAAHAANVEKFVFLGSSCIYPRSCPQPIKEEYLLTGPLEKTNSAYAIAKIAGIELINSYRKEYDKKWVSMMPTNLYGPRDNFELENSHVLPALIRRFIEASAEKRKVEVLWGDGSPLREFLHVDDLARAILHIIEIDQIDSHINVGSGEEISIRDLAFIVAELTEFEGEIQWDSTKPNGTPRKILDSSRINALGWKHAIALRDGIDSTIKWYKEADLKGVVRK